MSGSTPTTWTTATSASATCKRRLRSASTGSSPNRTSILNVVCNKYYGRRTELKAGEWGARVEVSPAVAPLAFGAADVARVVGAQRLDGEAFSVRPIDTHGDHAAAARLDRVLRRRLSRARAVQAHHHAG